MSDPLVTCSYPKYAGRTWEDVLKNDRGYIEWLISDAGPTMSEELYDHLEELLEEDDELDELEF